MQTSRIFDPIVTVEGILRLVADDPALMGGLIELVRPQFGGHIVGYFNKLVRYVPRLIFPQIDCCHGITSISDFCWWNRENQK